jgi:hypothetical protein
MKHILFIVMLMVFISFFAQELPIAYALDVNAIFQQLKNELLSKGLTSIDVKAVEQPTKNLISSGANTTDIKNMVLDFANKGFKGTKLESLVSIVSDLVKSGDSLKVASDSVSQAIQTASASGLKGDNLLAKIKELVSQHKAQIVQVKSTIGSKLGGFLKSK